MLMMAVIPYELTANKLGKVPGVPVEHTFEILDESVRHHLEDHVLVLQLAVPGHQHLPPGVRAEGAHEAALQGEPYLVGQVEQRRLGDRMRGNCTC